jgi:sugar phosphate isomerase/epimerase
MPPLFLSHNPQFSPLPEIVSLCEANGFGIELAAYSDIVAVEDPAQTNLHLSVISNISQRSIHGPYLDLYPGSPNAAIRQKTLECFERVYQIALSLSVQHIVFHHNYDPAACSKNTWAKCSCEFWRNYLKDKSADIKIHLENIMDESPELISEVVRQVASPNLDIALDIGHAHAYSKTPLLEWIEITRDSIGYVHLHDNRGREDDHLALGAGNSPLIETLNALRVHAPEAVWSIESGGKKMYRSIEWLGENGYLGKR